ncbi:MULTISPECIES: hypothetical protein [unclassified Pseudoclavibacter]|uniref:hypothetical protein n=1 Tax=unclassified Pseudoclavibacter TaxID=2615177 RepID=UPI001BA4DD1D|nr:hypothetical protein [Pseudoclavibacter sp. Marseille-Q4354]MBS3177743.1 hypothetical protein [Pseudoclavibacter sp. Marseille-Q4354]
MPHERTRHPDHSRRRALWVALWWIETFVVHGPGDVEGEAIRHGDEYSGFILDCYTQDASGRRLYDSAFFSRPKGGNKSGLAGELVLLEAVGPSRFAGWAKGGETYEFLGQTYTYEPGEAMARPVKMPYIRIMATEEGQTGNVFDLVYRNLESGPLSQLKAYGIDVGRTRILLADGGEIIPSTAGAASKDGGKETFAVADETHLYDTPTLRSMYNTVSRNLPKRGKIAEPWMLETSTMYSPGADSIAERTYKYAQNIRDGKTRRGRLLVDHRWGLIEEEQLGDEQLLRAALTDAYGEALDWNSLEDLVDKIFDARTSPREALRYYLNALTAASDAWVTPQQMTKVKAFEAEWQEHADRGEGENAWKSIIAEGEQIALGFDGALTGDSTALVGCRISDGLLFTIKLEEVPDGPEAATWRVDEEAFDAIVAQVMERQDVVAFFADPPYWQRWVDAWETTYGPNLRVKSMASNAIRFWTENPRPMVAALERLHTAISGQQDVRVFADPRLIRHFENARRRARKQGDLIFKETPKSPLKIDAAMAATLAYAARNAYLLMLLGQTEEPEPEFYMPKRLR